ncbi:MAG TPA: sensor domain-containing diguanylate cyclase [Gaiellaceae bacterium]|nr:sensor domain-containing diguanylate cyclase [Gaiellaceae bacterium]
MNLAASSSAVRPASDDSRFQAFERHGLLSRAAPFLGAMFLAIMVYPLPPQGHDSSALIAAVALNVLILISALVTPWRLLPHFAQVVPPFAYFVVIALLREADGGALSSYSELAMLPVFWLALYGTRRELGVGILGVASLFLAPLLFVGSPEYPSSEWTRGLLWICVAPVVGFTVQSLVRQLRERAAENLRRAEELQLSQEETRKLVVSMTAVTEATREIARTTDSRVSREVICSAACTITGARFAKLMEPGSDGDLVMTANYGLQGAPPLKVTLAGQSSGAAATFLSKKPLFVADARGDAGISQRVVQTAGAVSMHFEPVLRQEEAVAVLVVGWNSEIDGTGRIAASMRMLAAETAMALERSDLLARLEESARTDDLTDLYNRRAWEEQLPREMARARRKNDPLCVAMLDLDFFKNYNDERGHQAGDRLLKQSATAWREELRPSDMLARYGGEEFTVVLSGCNIASAKDIVERLRAAMPADQTVSAGVACWNGRESADELVGRADAALYEAKRTGRNRLVTAGGAPPVELRSLTA